MAESQTHDSTDNQLSLERQREIVHAVREVLPEGRYGLRGAIEQSGLQNIQYDKRYDLVYAEVYIGTPSSGVVAYECASGSVFAEDILENLGCDAQLATAGAGENKYIFASDTVLLLPGGRVFRVAPIYPTLTEIEPGQHFSKVRDTPELLEYVEKIRAGVFPITMNPDRSFPLSAFHKGGLYETTGIGLLEVTRDGIILEHSTLVGDGSRRSQSFNVQIEIPRGKDLYECPADFDVLVEAGVSIPSYDEKPGLTLGGSRITRTIGKSSHPLTDDRIKSSRLMGFKRDSVAVSQIIRSLSHFFAK